MKIKFWKLKLKDLKLVCRSAPWAVIFRHTHFLGPKFEGPEVRNEPPGPKMWDREMCGTENGTSEHIYGTEISRNEKSRDRKCVSEEFEGPQMCAYWAVWACEDCEERTHLWDRESRAHISVGPRNEVTQICVRGGRVAQRWRNQAERSEAWDRQFVLRGLILCEGGTTEHNIRATQQRMTSEARNICCVARYEHTNIVRTHNLLVAHDKSWDQIERIARFGTNKLVAQK